MIPVSLKNLAAFSAGKLLHLISDTAASELMIHSVFAFSDGALASSFAAAIPSEFLSGTTPPSFYGLEYTWSLFSIPVPTLTLGTIFSLFSFGLLFRNSFSVCKGIIIKQS